MLDGLRECYRILEVEPGASLEEVKRSYRELVKVWHPDRFANEGQRLQQKSQEKLKQINLAYERICDEGFAGSKTHSASPGTSSSRPATDAASSAFGRSSNGRNEPSREPSRQSPPTSSGHQSDARQLSNFLQVLAALIVFVIIWSAWVSNLEPWKPAKESPLTAPNRVSDSNLPQTRTAAQNSETKPFQGRSVEDIRRLVIEAQLKRAEKGDAQASYDLANRYITEDGVLKDYAEAKRLLEQAVKNADSQTLRDKAQTQLDNLNKVLKQ